MICVLSFRMMRCRMLQLRSQESTGTGLLRIGRNLKGTSGLAKCRGHTDSGPVTTTTSQRPTYEKPWYESGRVPLSMLELRSREVRPIKPAWKVLPGSGSGPDTFVFAMRRFCATSSMIYQGKETMCRV